MDADQCWELVNDLPHVKLVKAERRIRELEETLRLIDRTLTIPAAEYVPAIGDVFTLIDQCRVPDLKRSK